VTKERLLQRAGLPGLNGGGARRTCLHCGCGFLPAWNYHQSPLIELYQVMPLSD